MLVKFQIEYKTHLGQVLMVLGSLPELGEGIPQLGKIMHLKDAERGIWEYEIELEKVSEFTYRYVVKDDNFETFIEEWGEERRFSQESQNDSLIIQKDSWRSISDSDLVLHSSAFLNAIFKTHEKKKDAKVKGDTKNMMVVRFRPMVPRIKPGHVVAVSGSAKNLGAWKEDKALLLGNVNFPQWSGEVKVNINEFPLRYKYLIMNSEGYNEFWEKSFDRVVELPGGDVPSVIEINDEKFDFPRFPWKGTGVAVPVFSLRRREGFGIGEFTDLKLLVDWSAEVGIKLIQILPVNDTVAKHSWTDSYPYAAISVYALHPIYINLKDIGKLESEINQEIIEAQGKYLNTLSKIDYEAVMALKSRFFKLIYDQKKKEFLKDPEFLEFFKTNEYWLRPYAAFSFLRDLFNTPDFSRWGEYSKPTAELLAQITDSDLYHYDDIAVHYFIQFHAHKQLLDAANYARLKGIVLKGDIPIGIYRNSVDAWLSPDLYHMDCQAGAPPDDFSAKGQNWKFPTYNWEEMEKDNYSWWQQRLKQLSNYFDAFRIDHILGFFRIWEIPSDQVEGLMGYFNPSIPYYRDEIQSRGIWFNEDRFCKPYIREHFLYERFGDLTELVKYNYLLPTASGCYDLHPDFNTQRKIEEYFKVEPDTSPDERIKYERLTQGLFSLVSEVLFLPAPGTDGNAFFPRHALHFTKSYQELDQHTKHIINQIYLEYFYHRNEKLWESKAMAKLPVLKKATNMLLCGEDLGMVPACVPHVMGQLGILSLEVQRMPKDPKNTFGHPTAYPYLSVATPSSHDTSTVRGWWHENQAQSQRFYNEILGNYGEAPSDCNANIVQQIINQHLYSPSMWAIFAIQDLLGMDEDIRLPDPNAERINQPGNPNHYWRYRLHISLEDLLEEHGFNKFIRNQINSSGRLEAY